MKFWTRVIAATVATLTAVSMAACAPPPKLPDSPTVGGMSFITFVIDVYDPKTNEDLHLPTHVTIYLEDATGGSLFNVDGNSGREDIFPFDVPGPAQLPVGTWPTSPVRQNIYYDYRDGSFTLRAKATTTAPAGTAFRCSIEDIGGSEVGHSYTIFFKNSPLDTLTVECSY